MPEFVKSGASFIRRTPVPAYPGVEAIILDDLYKVLIQKGYVEEPSKSEAAE